MHPKESEALKEKTEELKYKSHSRRSMKRIGLHHHEIAKT